MQKIRETMRGWLTCLVVLALMLMTPFQHPKTALAADYVEELRWSQMETELLEGNSVEWYLENETAAEQMETETTEENVEEAVQETAEAVEPIADMASPMEEKAVEAVQAEAQAMEEIGAEMPERESAQTIELPAEELASPKWRISLNSEQLSLLERCVMAEGGGESYECQMAIACVIINRVLSEDYPDTVDEVIKQEGQFSTWPTKINSVIPTDEVKQAVREALTEASIPEDVLYFRADRYHRWGTNYCRMDNTYFSTP